MEFLELGDSVPSDIHSAVAEMQSLEEYKKDFNRHGRQLEGRLNYLEQYVLDFCKSNEHAKDGVVSRGILAEKTQKKIGVVRDWDAFHGHILDERDFYLMKKDAVSARILEQYEKAFDWDVELVIDKHPESCNPCVGQILIGFQREAYGHRAWYKFCSEEDSGFEFIDWGEGVTKDSHPTVFIRRLMAEGVIPSPPPGTDVIVKDEIKLKKV